MLAAACGDDNGGTSDNNVASDATSTENGGTMTATTSSASSTTQNGSGTQNGSATNGTSTSIGGSSPDGNSSTDASDLNSSGGSTNTGSGGEAGAPTSDGSGGTGQGGSASGSGCSSSNECEPNEWCDFPDDRCGEGDLGTCNARPMGASDGVWTCGCDGAVRSSPWLGWIGGVDADALARCADEPLADGAFWCGGYRCFAPSYCRITETPCATHFECESAGSSPECTGCDCVESGEGTCTEDAEGVATLKRTLDECVDCTAAPFGCE